MSMAQVHCTLEEERSLRTEHMYLPPVARTDKMASTSGRMIGLCVSEIAHETV